MFDNAQAIKDELWDFIDNYKDVGGVFYRKSRFIHAKPNFGLKMFNLNDYIEMRYSLEHIEPGNEIKWSSLKTVNIQVDFLDDSWLSFAFSGLAWNEQELLILKKYIEEHPDLSLVEHDRHFVINGIFMFDIDEAKRLIMEIDKQLNEYYPAV